jgi:hypothetical protein
LNFQSFGGRLMTFAPNELEHDSAKMAPEQKELFIDR